MPQVLPKLPKTFTSYGSGVVEQLVSYMYPAGTAAKNGQLLHVKDTRTVSDIFSKKETIFLNHQHLTTKL